MMISSAAAVLPALADLAAVKAVTGAVKANLIAAGGVEGALGTVTMPGKKGRTVEPSVRFEPRKVIKPTPKIEPRLRHEPEPVRVEPLWYGPQMPEMPSRVTPSPLTPVWEMPVINQADASVVVKQYQQTVEITGKGGLIDFFC